MISYVELCKTLDKLFMTIIEKALGLMRGSTVSLRKLGEARPGLKALNPLQNLNPRPRPHLLVA